MTPEERFVLEAAEAVNKKRFRDLVMNLDDPNSEQNKRMEQIRAQNAFTKGGRNGDIQHIASLTDEQDAEFSRAYGNTYYQDPEFFTKRFPQLLAVDKKDLI